jgi:hypothetical protein
MCSERQWLQRRVPCTQHCVSCVWSLYCIQQTGCAVHVAGASVNAWYLCNATDQTCLLPPPPPPP